MIFTFIMGLVLGIIFLNIPPALDTLMALYSVSYTDISVLISALLWSHALMQIPAGIITDRIGLKKTLFASIAFMGIGGFIPTLLPTLPVAVSGRVVAGIGTGLSFIATMKLIALYAPGGRIGAFQAFFAGAFSLGSILAYLSILNFGSIFHIASGATRPASLGLLFGLVNLIANLGAVAFTLTFGWAKDTFGSLSGGFGILALMCLAALIIGRKAIRKDAVS